mmetsp:Transcript_37057/g.147885  ORF Transcript_37057/g.147885 Transcript_37057/m.147885 type:complete len:292 (-) Transcript_37057:1747-2622(-)
MYRMMKSGFVSSIYGSGIGGGIGGVGGVSIGRRGFCKFAIDPFVIGEISLDVLEAEAQGKNVGEVLKELGDEDLQGFCRVKGFLGEEFGRDDLLRFAEEYVHDERVSRRDDDEFRGLDDQQKCKILHRVCCGEGSATYIDPKTGYTVFSAFAHLERGHCCGVSEDLESEKGYARSHRCRHCPYADDGTLKSKSMIQLSRNLSVVTSAREIVEEELARKREQIEGGDLSQKSTETCDDCNRTGRVTCARCNGFLYVFSPISQRCPKCDGKGTHPCVSCTGWRPKARKGWLQT